MVLAPVSGAKNRGQDLNGCRHPIIVKMIISFSICTSFGYQLMRLLGQLRW